MKVIDYVRQQNRIMQQQVDLAKLEIRAYVLENQSESIDWIDALNEKLIPEEINNIILKRFSDMSVAAKNQIEDFLFKILLNELEEIRNHSTLNLLLNL